MQKSQAASNVVRLIPPGTIRRSKTGSLAPIDPANDLLTATTISRPVEIVHGLLHARTKGVLAGSSKVGKTWLLLDLAASVATGTAFLKWPTTPGKVLFINFEIPRVFIKERLAAVQKKKGVADLSKLDVWTLRGQLATFQDLLPQIIQRGVTNQYSLIILDPIYKALVGRSESSASGIGTLCHNIDQIVEQTGAAVVYAHHFTKGNASKKKAMDRMSGSGVFARDADTIMTMTDHQQDGCFSVEITLRNLPPQPPFVVEWDFPVMVERADLDPDDLNPGNTSDLAGPLSVVIGLLDATPLTSGEWQQAALNLGYSRATFFRVKQKLEAGKQVKFDQLTKTFTRTAAQVTAYET